MEAHEKFNTRWRTVYSRDLAEFTKEEIMAMCSKNVVDIHMPRKNSRDGLMGPPIIELEFEKYSGTTYNYTIKGEKKTNFK